MAKLTALKVQKAKPGRYGDGGNLYLDVSSTLAKKWILRFRLHGRNREMGLGSAKVVSLAEARDNAAAALHKIAKGIDPIDDRQKSAEVPTFGALADEVRNSLSDGFRNKKHRQQWQNTLEIYAAGMKTKPVNAITTGDILDVLKPIWLDKPETASRLRGRLEKVLDAAKSKGFREGDNPALWRGHLDHWLPKQPTLTRGHHKAMDSEKVPGFFRQLKEFHGTAAVALRFCILTSARTKEVLDQYGQKLIGIAGPGIGQQTA